MRSPVLRHPAQVKDKRLVELHKGPFHQQLLAALRGRCPLQSQPGAAVEPQLQALPLAGARVGVVAEFDLQLSHGQALVLLQHGEVKVQALPQAQQPGGLPVVNEVA